MTDRDNFAGPSCPVCTRNDNVQRIAPRWVCFHCWTVFSGSADEWARTREMREHYAKRESTRESC